MNEYTVSDYGIFSDAVATTSQVQQNIESANTTLKDAQQALSNESIFMGPICDSCVGGFTKAGTSFTTLNDNFNSIKTYLIDSATNYQAGDDASAKLLSLDDSGTIEATNLMSTTYNGEPVYYYQKGYFDEQGNLHEWPTTWGKTIASSGCGPTSMASILATLLGDRSITPSTIANEMSYNGNIGMNFVPHACEKYGLNYSGKPHLSKENVNTFLQNNGKIMVAVNGGGHYIALLGVNNSTNPPTYIVCDPNDRNTATKVWEWKDFAAHTQTMFIAPPGKTVEQCLPGQTVQV